jgi:Glycosyltransferase sugar-binding region containing DXD motif
VYYLPLETKYQNMNTSNKIIQGLWVGKELSVMENLSIKSFIANGHEYHLYVYEKVKNIPTGTMVKDGNEILSEDQIFKYQSGWGKGSYAGFADLFRYHLLKKCGGWWADTDVICLKPFDLSSSCVIASSYEGKWGEPANDCVLKLPKSSELTDYLVDATGAMNLETAEFGQTGPLLLQKAVKDLNLSQYVVSHKLFCPITWRAVNKKIVYPSVTITVEGFLEYAKDIVRPILHPHLKTGGITSNSYSLHLWNEIWRQNSLDKNQIYDNNCLYEILKRKYLS